MGIKKVKKFKTRIFILIFSKDGLLLEDNDLINKYFSGNDISIFVNKTISEYIKIQEDVLNPEIVEITNNQDDIKIFYKIYIPICFNRKGYWGSIYDTKNDEYIKESFLKKIFN